MFAKLTEFAAHHYILVLLFIALAVLLFLYESRKSGRLLGHAGLTLLVNSGEGVVLDIRERKDFTAGHIVDALNISYGQLAGRLGELEKYRGKTLVVVDALGQHSGPACVILQKAGFQVARLAGGMSTWRAENLPVVN